MAECFLFRAEGVWAEAVTVLKKADEIVRRAGLRQEYVAPVLPWLATALRSQAEALSPYEASSRRPLLRRARRAARRGWRVSRFYRNNAPHALRERALLASLAGRDQTARRLMTRSLAMADAQGARYEHALSRRAWGWIGLPLGTVAADQVVADAEADIAALLPAPEPEAAAEEMLAPTLSLADRFATVLAVGRKIASAPSPQAVYGAVREAAVTLLRGEWCHVVDVDDTGLSARDSDGHLDKLSHSLVRRALEAGRPVVLADDSADSADSIVLSGLRSALCAPIFCDGHPVACVYVTHSNVGRLFGDEEVQLTEFIVTLAGAALEHVAGTEARFRSLAQNSSDVITIVDRNATIVYQSSAVTRVFGLKPDGMVRTPLAEWLHPDDAGAILETIARVVDEGEDPRLVECRLRHHDGSWRHVETAINNLVHDPGVNGVVLNSRDVSDRKRAEQEVRETLEREHRMRQRLQEADKLKTDFVSSVSHELRTPLTSILGYLEMMSDGYGGEMSGEQARMLGIVDRNAQRLLILIEELLIMSRVESGTFRLTAGPVEIAPLVDGALQAVHPDLVGRDLVVTVDVATDADVIQGDAGQLDRVMINLLSNAIKFTPDGGSVTVSACRDADSVVIRVGDTGMGIPVDDQARIFERFFRSSATQHLAVPGTGLGLSITKAIIEEHGGAISVSSQPGEGTEVVVDLPLVPSGVRSTHETGAVRTPEGEKAATMAE
ncbi:MAG: ATP-binding protein [Acidimicrobiales bacterium]